MIVSLCLTHFNRFEMIVKSFKQVLSDERIKEVIISDDKSTDGSYEKLIDYFRDNKKVKIYQNEKNEGMSKNKAFAIGSSYCPYSIIFDSDNIITTRYLDALESVDKFDYKTIYLPIGALPNFDYSKYSGLTISKENIKKYMNEDLFRCALNTCNCLVNRNFYLTVFREDKTIGCADTINHIYNHIKAGGKLYFVPNLVYDHLVHSGSGYLQDVNYNLAKAKEVEKKILAL